MTGSSAPGAHTIQHVEAGGQRLRVSVRHGEQRDRVPLLVINGIGASLEELQPFV